MITKSQRSKFGQHCDRILCDMTAGWLWRPGDNPERLHMFVNEPGPMPTDADVRDLETSIENELIPAWGRFRVSASIVDKTLKVNIDGRYNGELLHFEKRYSLAKRTTQAMA